MNRNDSAVSHDSARTFVVMQPTGGADVRSVNDEFWSRLHADYPDFKGHNLISTFAIEANWDAWECHPHGDEYVMLLSGVVAMRLKMEDGEERVTLDQLGQFVVIPRGIWHTAEVIEPGRMLFITPGHGTEHAPATS